MGSSFGLQNQWFTAGMRRLFALRYEAMLGVILVSSLCGQGRTQGFLTRGGALPAGGDLCGVTDPAPCFKRIAQDEAGMTRSVFHMKRSSLPVVLGLAAATGVAMHFDKQMSKTLIGLPINHVEAGHEADLVGVYGPFAAGGLLYFTGSVIHDSHFRETGVLATEAMVDAALIGKSLKYVVNRQGPGNGPDSRGFYISGIPRGGSMPSSHALNAWAFARVITGESHSKWVGVLAYSLATSVSLSRTVTGAHSVSDVIVGSALGYGIGEYVLHTRSRE